MTSIVEIRSRLEALDVAERESERIRIAGISGLEASLDARDAQAVASTARLDVEAHAVDDITWLLMELEHARRLAERLHSALVGLGPVTAALDQHLALIRELVIRRA